MIHPWWTSWRVKNSPLLCCTGQTPLMWCCSPLRSKPTKPEDTTPCQTVESKPNIKSCYFASACVWQETGAFLTSTAFILQTGSEGKIVTELTSVSCSEASVSLGTRQGRSISQFALSLSLLLLSLCPPRGETRGPLNVVFRLPTL